MRSPARHAAAALTLVLTGAVTSAVASSGAAQAVEPGADTFYTYSGSAPLASYAPGAVLATRSVTFSIASIPTPLTAVQLLYRSTDVLGRPVANVTSVVKPPAPVPAGAGKLVSYQSFYDSLNPADSPSRGLAGAAPSAGLGIVTLESALITPLLTAGYTVNIPDTEGQDADFAAGPEYGTLTLDSIRAASASPTTGVPAGAPVAMLGYSGGAIGTGWAAALAPSYAPDVNNRLVGATEGGVLVAPAHNLRYIDGTPMWGGVEGMALVGVGRSFDIDFTPYLSEFGRQQFAMLENASIAAVLNNYPDFRFARLVKPEYADPNSIKPFVDAANALNLGSAPAPTVPMQIFQGAGGEAERTPGDTPGIGPGDGVMVAGDVRTLARQYCAAGTPVDFTQDDTVSHTPGAGPWLAEALPFLVARFAGVAPTSTCSSIAAGNPLTPEVFRPGAGAGASGAAGAGAGGAAGPGTARGAASRTRTRVRLPRVWQVRGAESTRVAFAVVTKGATSGSAKAGRVVVKLDGRKVKSATVPVVAKRRGKVAGGHVRIPRSLAYGAHRITVRFRPYDAAAFTASRSRTITLTVVRSRPRT